MERVAIMEQTDEVQPGSLPDFESESRLRESDSGGSEDEINMELGFSEAVAEFERKMISTALKQNQNNVNLSAEQLKMTRHSLRYRMQQLGLIGTRNTGGDSK
jgi:DNA-binding NtrC family response regulator